MELPTIRLARSMLYVPASRPDMIEKAARSQADAVCIDLEDSVTLDLKEASRANVVRALTTLDFGPRTTLVRINDLETRYFYRDIVEVVEPVGEALDCIMIPKVDRPDHIEFVSQLLEQLELNMPRRKGPQIGIEAQIETARGFLWLREIGSSSERLESLIFGSGDYAASMRMPLMSIGESDHHDAAYPGHRWHAVMHGIVASARANYLRAMDGPYADFKDTAGLERACRTARALGFDGKQCIHPAQVATVNAVFTPTPDEVIWAEAIMAEYEADLEEGRGAGQMHGKMVDAASIRIAEVTLNRAEMIAEREKKL